MLLTLLIWLYVTVLTFLAGDALVRVGHRLTGALPVLATPLVCLLGAAGLTPVLGWLWLVVPLNNTTHLVLAGLLMSYAAWQRPRPTRPLFYRKWGWLGWLAVGVLLLAVWLRTVQFPRLVDTGGYHAPMIEWIHQYAVVPGLANLNYRFGFNNSWFLLSAFFRLQVTPTIPWHGLNGWLMVMTGWFSLTEWHRYQTGQQPFSAWLGGWLAPGLLVIFHWTLASPSPDLPTQVYVALCFWVWLRRAEATSPAYTAGWAWLLLVLSLSALTTKLSAVTVLLLPALVVSQWLHRGHRRSLVLWAATALVFTGYWWIANVVLTGYVAYPSLSPLADWFALDWKVPHDVIATGLHNLQQGTRGDAGNTFSLAWIPYWFRTRPGLEQGIFVALLAAPVLALGQRKAKARAVAGYGAALLTAWLGVVFWFLLAPEIRFGAGTVLVVLGMSYGPMLRRLTGGSVYTQPLTLGALVVTGLVLVVAAVRREPVGWLLPAGYPTRQLQTYQTTDQHRVVYPIDDLHVINGIRGYWGRCYDAPLPCSPYPVPGLRWRGSALQDGFQTTESNRH